MVAAPTNGGAGGVLSGLSSLWSMGEGSSISPEFGDQSGGHADFGGDFTTGAFGIPDTAFMAPGAGGATASAVQSLALPLAIGGAAVALIFLLKG